MDRETLEQRLDAGMSLAAIGRELGRHESTVAYWVGKHGLRAVNGERHAPRGGIPREELARLVAEGASIAEIAASVDRGTATVRHWLKEYGLETTRAALRKRGLDTGSPVTRHCARHGMTTFVRRSGGGYRCRRCRSDAVSRRRKRVKQLLVTEAGGRCAICGYDRCVTALAFHHLVPAEKRFAMSHRGLGRAVDRARAEASKCVLLCANCHAEVEAGLATVDRRPSAGIQCSTRLPSSPG